MKKWLKFFCLGFFTDREAKEGARRGYTNVFVALLMAFLLLWAGFVGADMLPFGARYDRSADFAATVHSVLANSDADKRITVEISGSELRAKRVGGEYKACLLVNTFESETDRENYSGSGYNVVVDTRSADTLAEVEAYCVSNDGKNTEISYPDYLTLSDVARLNFDFKLRYTGRELVLDKDTVGEYMSYLEGIKGEAQSGAAALKSDLAKGKITEDEYNRAVYELYFTNYYPDIAAYESNSSVPLLRNYYYRQYVEKGECKYLFIFDDYMAASFESGGTDRISFYGFYSGVEDGVLIDEGTGAKDAAEEADEFIKAAFGSVAPLTAYAHAMNVFSLIPFIALMPMVVTLLVHSVLKLRGVAGAPSLGGTFKIVGAYIWFSALVAAALTVIFAFLLPPDKLTVLPLLLFFIVLTVRSVIFTAGEIRAHIRQSKKRETLGTED